MTNHALNLRLINGKLSSYKHQLHLVIKEEISGIVIDDSIDINKINHYLIQLSIYIESLSEMPNKYSETLSLHPDILADINYTKDEILNDILPDVKNVFLQALNFKLTKIEEYIDASLPLIQFMYDKDYEEVNNYIQQVKKYIEILEALIEKCDNICKPVEFTIVRARLSDMSRKLITLLLAIVENNLVNDEKEIIDDIEKFKTVTFSDINIIIKYKDLFNKHKIKVLASGRKFKQYRFIKTEISKILRFLDKKYADIVAGKYEILPYRKHETIIDTNLYCIDKFEALKDIVQNKNNYDTDLFQLVSVLPKLCSRLITKSKCSKSELTDILDKFNTVYKKLQQEFSIRDVEPGFELISLYNAFKMYNNLFKYTLYIHYKDNIGIDAGGLIRQFLTKCSEQLISFNILKETEPGSNTYILNDKPTNDIYKNPGFYKCIGGFLRYCILFGIKHPFHLSRALLAQILYKKSDITKDEYVMFYLLDFPSSNTEIVGTLKEAKVLKHIELEKDTGLKSFSTEKQRHLSLIKSSKSSEYIVDNLLKNSNTSSNHHYRPRKVKSIGGASSSSKYLSETNVASYFRKKAYSVLVGNMSKEVADFAAGFNNSSHKFYYDNQISINQIDAIITGFEVNVPAIIRHIKDYNIVQCEHERQNSRFPLLKMSCNYKLPIQHKWFIDILEGKVPYPKDLVTKNRQFFEDDKLFQDFDKFLISLLYYWTASKSYNDRFEYKLKLFEDKQDRFVVAHTCFFEIEISDKIKSAKELYYRLLIGMQSIDEFGLA